MYFDFTIYLLERPSPALEGESGAISFHEGVDGTLNTDKNF
jgi:hypothetical protein